MPNVLGAKTLVNISEISHEEWLEWRKKGIGGSDAGAVMGINPYSSAFQVYCDKKGLLPETEDNEAMRQGRDLEDYVAQRFVEKEGKQIRRCNFMLQHKKYDFMLANVDRLIIGENAGLECKTTSLLTKTDYEAGEIPPHYRAQCLHYMAVTGASHWYIAILVLNKAFYVQKIDRNEDEIRNLIQNERSFWVDHILADFPPEADGSERAGKVIQQLYKGNNYEPYVLLYGLEDSVRKIKELDGKVKELSREEERLKQSIELEMKDSTMGKVEGFVINYGKYSRSSVDSKRLKSEQPNIYNEYLKTTGYRRLEIKPVQSGFNWITQ